MFCKHCGAQNEDNSQFCADCGKNFKEVKVTENPVQIPVQEVKTKKKSKLNLLVVLVVIGVIIVGAVIATVMYDDVDYPVTVIGATPNGYSATYGEVIRKYIGYADVWETRKQSKDLIYVDAPGKLKDTDGSLIDIVITFKLTPYEVQMKGMYLIEAFTIELDGEIMSNIDEIDFFITMMFEAYEAGYENFVEYYMLQ